MAKSTLTIKIQSDVAKALSGIESVNRKLDNLEKATGTVQSRFSKLALGLSSCGVTINSVSKALSILANGSKAVVDAYSAQEKAEIRLATTLKATGNAIGMSATELYELAASFQSVTTYGDEAIIEVEKLFVASGKISREAMPKAVEATLDMAAAMGEDLLSAAKRLAKVLADPKSNLDALKDANIQLSSAQKENIKQLQSSNNLYDAQSVVLQSIAETYGGIARAIADTDTGKLDKIKNVWSDIKEGLGKGLLDTISPALDILYSKLVQISNWVSNSVSTKEVMEVYKGGGTQDFSSWADSAIDSMIESVEKWLSESDNIPLTAPGVLGKGIEYGLTYGGASKEVMEKALEDAKKEKYLRSFGIHYSDLSDVDRAEVDEQFNIMATSRYGRMLKDYQEAGLDTTNPNWWRNANKNYFDQTDAYDVANYNGAVYRIGNVVAKYKQSSQPTASNTAEENPIVDNDNSATSVSSFISSHKSLSVLAQIAEYQKEIDTAVKLLGNITEDDEQYSQLEQIIASLKEKKSKLENPDTDTKNAIGPSQAEAFIDANKGLSISAQISEIYSKIETVTGLIGESSGSERVKLEEIRQSLYDELTPLERIKNGIEDAADATDKFKEKMETVNKYVSMYGSAVNSLLSASASYIDTLYSNQISAIDSMLSESEERWDKYLSRLDEKQELQKDSLAHLYDSGLISLEEYNDATRQLYDDKVAAETEAEEEEEKLQKKRNELAEKQFNANKANQKAQAVINGAMAITSIWATHAANPVTAGILTALSAATTAMQIATIESTKYTPMATGGIVTKPTYALLGEGGAKEAVLPLTETNMERAGLGASDRGVINISISIGTAYSSDQLSRDVYEGIERAQRTGLLPKWRYA